MFPVDGMGLVFDTPILENTSLVYFRVGVDDLHLFPVDGMSGVDGMLCEC